MNKAECKSILDYKQFPTYDILWCDPPWEERMTKWFRTKLTKDAGIKTDFTFEQIIDKLGELANPSKPLYIEYDIKHYINVIARLVKHGHNFVNVSEHPLYDKSRFVILAFNTDKFPTAETNGVTAIKETLNQYPTKQLVFDPFAGLGITAKAVITAGHYYHGSEINPSRYKKLQGVIEQNGHNKKGHDKQ